jgi:hypothetical protein
MGHQQRGFNSQSLAVGYGLTPFFIYHGAHALRAPPGPAASHPDGE